MKSKALLAALLLATSAGVIHVWAADEFRMWTNADNKQVEAAFTSVTGGTVNLKMRNGTVAAVPLDKLSQADQDWVKEHGTTATRPALGSTSTTAKAWPKSTGLEEAPKATVVKEDAAAKEYIYRTANFEFRCDSRLGADVVREFGRIFEGTLEINNQLPLDLKPKPEEGRELFVAQLFTNKDDYFKAGAIPGSAGVYMGGKQSIFVPIQSLGVKIVGKRLALEPQAENTTLIHEITHQMMNHWLGRLPIWFVEGSAEYVAAQKYHMGRFSLTNPGANVRKYLNDHKGVWDKKFTMWHIYQLMHIDSAAWSGAIGGGTGNAMRNYASATILAYYFYHVDGKGDAANIIAWLRAIESGTPQEEAAEKHLIRGRKLADIEKEIAHAMQKDGLALDFAGDAAPTGTAAESAIKQ